MTSTNSLVPEFSTADALDSRVHRRPIDGTVSITRGRTQHTPIRVCVYRPSNARIRGISDIGVPKSDGAPNYRDTLSGAPTIPVKVPRGGGS